MITCSTQLAAIALMLATGVYLVARGVNMQIEKNSHCSHQFVAIFWPDYE